MAENKVSDTVNDMVNSMVEDINSAQNGSNKVSAIKDNVGYDMSRVHSANLKILKEIDRICRKYKIQYALDAGTLIGAVRHKGFIPWDDDADIVFTRNQFEAFKKVVRRELPDTMELVEPDSFHEGKAFSTSRAGNVIGGGDFASDRIIPDCVRAAAAGKPIMVRNPHSTRPFQHVLEPLAVYLTIAMEQYKDSKYQDYYNVGPDDRDCVTTGTLTDLFCNAWGEGMTWENHWVGGPHEANFLKLDCSKIKTVFGWKPRYTVKEAVEKTVEWSKEYLNGADMLEVTDRQIREFFA